MINTISFQAEEIGEGYASRHGAILADEMGLGKTFTSIALSWLLLKQYPAVRRIIVVTPVSYEARNFFATSFSRKSSTVRVDS